MNQTLTLKGNYEWEGSDIPLTIQISRPAVNVTVAIIVAGKYGDPRVAAEHCGDTKTIFGGTAFCNPKDEFDILEGAKVACRHALEIGSGGYWNQHNRRNAAIYSACRTLIAEKRLEENLAKIGLTMGSQDFKDALIFALERPIYLASAPLGKKK